MKFFLSLLVLISLDGIAAMSPEEEKNVDSQMITRNMDVRKKLGGSRFDNIEHITGRGGDFYSVLKGRCIALVEIVSKGGRMMPGSSTRAIKEVKGPYCFKN